MAIERKTSFSRGRTRHAATMTGMIKHLPTLGCDGGLGFNCE